MTLREALMMVDLDKVYQYLNDKDRGSDSEFPRETPTLEQTTRQYGPVVQELLSKPQVRRYRFPICVEETFDDIDQKNYVNVYLRNPKYVEPPKGAKPWGGKNPPQGYYNVNESKYIKRYAFGFTTWSKIIDTPVEVEAKCSLEVAVAEMLWELTFDGWTEEKVKKNQEAIIGKIKQAQKQIKEGKCVKLPPKEKGGLSIVIPDIVAQQIIDLNNKKNKQ